MYMLKVIGVHTKENIYVFIVESNNIIVIMK